MDVTKPVPEPEEDAQKTEPAGQTLQRLITEDFITIPVIFKFSL